jgi:hypothetical protein
MEKMVEGIRQELLSQVGELIERGSSSGALVDGVVEAINDKVGKLILEARREPERAYIRVILTSGSLVGWVGTVGDLMDDYLLGEQDLVEAIWHFARIGIIELPEGVAGKDDIDRSTRVKLLTRSIYRTET